MMKPTKSESDDETVTVKSDEEFWSAGSDTDSDPVTENMEERIGLSPDEIGLVPVADQERNSVKALISATESDSNSREVHRQRSHVDEDPRVSIMVSEDDGDRPGMNIVDLEILSLFDPLLNSESSHDDLTHTVQVLTMEESSMVLTALNSLKLHEIDMSSTNLVAELDRYDWDFNEKLKASLQKSLIDKIEPDMKMAAWRAGLGLKAREVLRTATWTVPDDINDMQKVKDKLLASVETPSTMRMAMTRYWIIKQQPGESVKDFIGRLEQLGAQCKWPKESTDLFLQVRLGTGLRSKNLRTWINSQPDSVKLPEIKRYCLAQEAVEEEDNAMQQAHEKAYKEVHENKTTHSGYGQGGSGQSGRKAQKINCKYCGLTHWEGKNPRTGRWNCPASDHRCANCGVLNHHERICGRKPNPHYKPEWTLKNDGKQGNGQQQQKKNFKKNKKVNEVAEESGEESDSQEGVDYLLGLSASSEEELRAPVARHSFHQQFAIPDGAGPSGLRPGQSGPAQGPWLKNYRIPKKSKSPIGKAKTKNDSHEGDGAWKRYLILKQRKMENAQAVRAQVSAYARNLKIANGEDIDLMSFREVKSGDESNIRELGKKQKAVQTDALENPTRKKRSWSENISINGRTLKMKVDSGSSVTVLTWADFCKLQLDERLIKPSKSRIISYSGNVIQPLGKIMVTLKLHGKCVQAKCLIVEEASTSLLGFPEGMSLNLFRCQWDRVFEMSMENQWDFVSGKDRSENDVIPQNPWETLPPCKFSVKLHLVEGAQPKVLPPRRLPVAIREKVKEELERMVRLGVISPVNEPREWCHQMVVADKPDGRVRICLDPRLLNKYLRREEFQLPDFDAMAAELSEAKVYSTIDLLSGFWQFGLDEESMKLLTFATPYGRYQYNRLPFGLSCAPEMFHKRVLESLRHIPGVIVYIDDILIWGRTKEEHDERLEMVLKALKEHGFSLNPKKCLLAQESVKFLGHIVENGELRVDPQKVEAIRNIQSPKDRRALRSFLGMLSYIRKFVPDYNELTSPFRSLLKERTPYIWGANEEKAMDRIRNSDAWTKALAIFRPGERVEVWADASSYGLGAVLMQGGRPVYFCSCSLTKSEESWPQIDKELLALVWALERLDVYTYGHQVLAHTDHRPLLGLKDKPLDHCSLRQQRLLGRLMRYDLELCFKPGKDMLLPDTLSRAPVGQPEELEDIPFMGTDLLGSVVYVSELTEEHRSEFEYTENCDKSKEKIIGEARLDEQYAETIAALHEGWNPGRQLACGEYWSARDNLFESEGLLYFNGRLVIPKKLRPKFLRALHRGHVGITAMRKRATTIWWPGITKEIQECVHTCHTCQSQSDKQQKEKMISFEIPSAPGLVVASDFFELGGKNFVLITDVFSGWTEFFSIPSMTAVHLIRAVRKFVVRNGIPRVFVSDQGTAFTSREFKEFCEKHGIMPRTNSPKHSQGNAHAEAAVKRVKKWLKRCSNEDDLCSAILAWHQTPMAEGRPSPAEIHMGRSLRDELSWKVQQRIVCWEDVKCWKTARNMIAKEHYDKGARNLNEFEAGTKVLVWNDRSKLWDQGTVKKKLDRPRSYLICLESGSEIERNRRDLKLDRTCHSKRQDSIPWNNISLFQPVEDSPGTGAGADEGRRIADDGRRWRRRHRDVTGGGDAASERRESGPRTAAESGPSVAAESRTDVAPAAPGVLHDVPPDGGPSAADSELASSGDGDVERPGQSTELGILRRAGEDAVDRGDGRESRAAGDERRADAGAAAVSAPELNNEVAKSKRERKKPDRYGEWVYH